MADGSASGSSGERVKVEKTDSQRPSKAVRTTLACTRCRQRRTKCSGLPAPCDICRKDGEFCHFHPRMDSRRKDGLSSNDVAIRRKSILHGLLLAITSNPQEEIRDMIALLRSPEASPSDMAESLHRQLCIALSNSHHGAPQPTQDDLLSLVLLDALSHHKQLMKTTVNTVVQQQSDDPTGNFAASSSVHDTLLSSAGSSNSPFLPQHTVYDAAFPPNPDIHLHFYEQTPSQQPRFVLPSSQVEPAYSHSMSSWDGSSSTEPYMPKVELLPKIDTTVTDLDYPVTDGTNSALPTANSNQTGFCTFDLPTSLPYTDFSRLCLSLRDSGRQMLAQGHTLNELVGNKRLNCELLFRDRIDQDRMDISNWSCEVARRLPHLPPGTRIAFALCFARMMPYLILPCQETWDALPEALRPTLRQFNNVHDITVAFLPIPSFRNLIPGEYVDWLLYATQFFLKFEWHGVWGDTNGASLTEAGNWFYPSQPLRLRKNIDFAIQIDQGAGKYPASLSELKAISMDATSGEHYISEEFEAQCWIPENWHFNESILGVWPELKMHPYYLRKGSIHSMG